MPTVLFALLSFILSWFSVPIPASSWPIGPALDQGKAPDCVGYAFATWLQTGPGPRYHVSGSYLYAQAKLVDGNNDEGTSPATMVEVTRQLGYLQSATSTTVITEALRALVQGPVLVEAAWYTGMDTPVRGLVRPTGVVRAFHEFMCYSYDAKTQLVACENSWGPTYGLNGHFYISSDNLQHILHQQGVTLPVKSKQRSIPWYRALTPSPS